jgi:predicted ATP-dependent endonuclease of OLD family
MDYPIKSFRIQRFRSILDLTIEFSHKTPYIICGENNIGKTNVLRALNAFFNHLDDPSLLNPSQDIPHHIYFGSKGAGARTELTAVFNKSGKSIEVHIKLWNSGKISYKIDGTKAEPNEVENILSEFRFFYVEAHNIDIPSLIHEIMISDALLPLDKKRSKQSASLQKLDAFIKTSKRAITDIERSINAIFQNLTDFDGILKDKTIVINFGEYNRLRDVIKLMTTITLHDGNNHGIAAKGSGAQRAVFLTLMQFIATNTKKHVIWGIDEPEVFLQPKLQKKVAAMIKQIASLGQPVIITTHSPHFIELENLSTTYLFQGEVSVKAYARKPGQVFYEVNTQPIPTDSEFEKAELIRKHLGISTNDGWAVMPINVLVEGEEDKKYLEKLMGALSIPIPNITFSGGASKIGGNLQFYNHLAKELTFNPTFRCLFDNDEEGRDQKKRLKPESCRNLNIEVVQLTRFDGESNPEKGNWEIEDFIPQELLIKCINALLKSEGYKQITRRQIDNRVLAANLGKSILQYAEECTSHNNPDKESLNLNHEGRKKMICRKFYSTIPDEDIIAALEPHQWQLLQKLARDSSAP